MESRCACGLVAVSRCTGCDEPKCHTHMTHTFGATALRNLCATCAVAADGQSTVERQRIDVRLLIEERNREAAIHETVRRLVVAGSPGAVPHVRLVPRRLRSPRTEPVGVDGFPIGRIRHRVVDPDPRAGGAEMTEESEALVLTDGRVVAVGGEELRDLDRGVVRDRIQAHARRHGVPLEP